MDKNSTSLLYELYDIVFDFSEGFAEVLKDGLGCSFINTEGKLINDDWYDYVEAFYNGFAMVYKTEEDFYNDKYYYLGTDGQLYDSNKQPLQ